MSEFPSPRRARFASLVPRFTLRTLLLAVLVVAVLLRAGQWAWPRIVLYYQDREYVALQATKQPFVDDQRKRFQEDKRKNPGVSSLTVDDARPVPDDYIILVRSGNMFGCFIPRNQGKKRESLEYDWYFRNDGQGRFPAGSPDVQSGRGSSGPYVSGGTWPAVKFGPFDFEWSGNGPGWGYLYYRMQSYVSPQTLAGDPLAFNHPRICTTNVKSIDLVDARDAKWIYMAFPGDEGVPGNVDLTPPTAER